MAKVVEVGEEVNYPVIKTILGVVGVEEDQVVVAEMVEDLRTIIIQITLIIGVIGMKIVRIIIIMMVLVKTMIVVWPLTQMIGTTKTARIIIMDTMITPIIMVVVSSIMIDSMAITDNIAHLL